MVARLLIALTTLVVFAAPAAAQDMPLLYDFTWTVDSRYSPLSGGPGTRLHLDGSGLLTYTASPESRQVTMSFGTPSNGGNFSFISVGTSAGLHPDDTFRFTTGLEALNPPIPGGCGAYPGGRDCRVAAFTTPSNAFAAPSSFTLLGQYGYDCLGRPGMSCNGAGNWESMLHGSATLHVASALEPASTGLVGMALLGAAWLRRRQR